MTRFGDRPSHEAYDPLGYAAVCDLLDDVLRDGARAPNADARMAIGHYTDMVRRHLVGRSGAIELAQEIYRKHSKALDFIQEHRPDPQRTTQGYLLRLIDETEGMLFKQSTGGGRFLWFCPEEWDTPSGFVGFVFHSHTDRLELYLEVSWGDKNSRRKLFEVAERDDSPFNHLVEKTRGGVNPKLYRRSFLAPGYYGDYSEQERQQEIRRQWTKFLKDLVRMKAMLREEARIWKSVGAVEDHPGIPGGFVGEESDLSVDERPEREN